MKVTKKQARIIKEMDTKEVAIQGQIEILIMQAHKANKAKWGYIRKLLGVSKEEVRIGYDPKTREATVMF